MTDQTFNGPVDQVAGGNINNYGPVTWDQLPTDELHERQKRNRSDLWAARRRMVFNFPVLVLVITLPIAVAYLIDLVSQMGAGHLGTTASQLPSWAFFGYAIFGVVLPFYLMGRKWNKEADTCSICKAELRGIQVALNRRR